MKRAFPMVVISLLALGGPGCGGEDPVAAQPTWVDDVLPILRGNCLTCHGAGPRDKDAKRWDFFYDPADPRLHEVGVPPNFMATISLASGRWPLWLALTGGDRMPPVPAPPLSQRDREVLQAFQKNPRRGTRPANHKPTAAWSPQSPWFLVSDGDHEQVLGKLMCGPVEVLIDRTGRQQLPDGAVAPCLGKLYDGQDLQPVTLE